MDRQAGSTGADVENITYQRDKKSGNTYAYRRERYLDPRTGRMSTRREYVGRLDPATGKIVPKAGPGKRNRRSLGSAPDDTSGPVELAMALSECRTENEKLREAVRDLRRRNSVLEAALSKVLDSYSAVFGALDGALLEADAPAGET